MPLSDLHHDEFTRIYGPWRARTPFEVAELFEGYAGHWWVAGGWAIETFTGVSRAHGDCDPSVPRSELPLLRRHLAGRLDVWAADQEVLRILLPGDIDADPDPLPDSCENVWARPSGGEPWEYDIILMTTEGDRWVYKRDPRTSLPLDAIVRVDGGIPFLRPEIQLLHKAPGLRPKDQADFEAAAPLLDPAARQWLREALGRTHPAHPWLADL